MTVALLGIAVAMLAVLLTPCRVGATRGVEVIDTIMLGGGATANPDSVVLLQDLCELMTDGSLCAMGGLTPMPVLSVLQHFPQDLEPSDRSRP